MESKLNALAIETYNTAFTNRVINDFFARHEKINGEQILKLTPVPQVNLLVIKNLFNTWQKEAASMRSPYFNYQHPKVQEAQKAYMNTLSRHISVDETRLKPLVMQAVQDTLILIFTPILHIRKALQASSGSPQEANEIFRYVKINQAYAQEAKNILNQQEVSDEQWIEKLTEELQQLETEGRLQPESPTPYMEQFSQVLPLKPSEVLKDEELEAEDDEHTDFFTSLSGRLEKEERRQPEQKQQQVKTGEEQQRILEQKRREEEEQKRIEEQEYLEEQKRREAQQLREEQEYLEAQKRRKEEEYRAEQKHREEQAYIEEQRQREEQQRKEEEQKRAAEQRSENPPIQQTHASTEPEEDFPAVSDTASRHAQLRRSEPEFNTTQNIRISSPATNEERSNKTLNEKFGREYKSLNEKLTTPAEEKPRANPLQHIKKPGNIRSGIGLNQRFMFTNELFDGDTNAFNQALDQLDGFDNYQQAYQYTLRQYARTYEWDLDGEASQEFLEVLQSRYRA